MVATRNCFSAPDTNTIIQVRSLNVGDKTHTEKNFWTRHISKKKITKKYFRKKTLEQLNSKNTNFEKVKFRKRSGLNLGEK